MASAHAAAHDAPPRQFVLGSTTAGARTLARFLAGYYAAAGLAGGSTP